MLGRITIFLYGVFCYLVFFATFLYAISFLGDFGVPKSIDSGTQGSLGRALAVDVLLLGLFAVQHSLMARPWFKRAWTRIVPPAAERSTYVLFASVAMILLFWKWQPIGGLIWQLDTEVGRLVAYGVYAFGWALLLLATFLIDHFDLFRTAPGLSSFPWAPVHGSAISDAVALPLRTASHLCRLALHLLGDSADDRGSPGFCVGDHCLHPHRNFMGGARSAQRPWRDIPALPRAGSEAYPHTVWEKARHRAGSGEPGSAVE